MKRITLILAFVFSVLNSGFAQVSSYSFLQGIGSYTPITGGTALGTTTTDDQRFVDPLVPAGGTTSTGVGFPIGFNFTYNGFVYDRFAINANGWISLGTSTLTPSVNLTSSSSYTPLSSTSTGVSNDLVARIAGFGRDLQAQTGAELRYELSGVAPNQVLTVQWTNYRKYGATGDSFNFQIKLYETTNVVQVVFGTMTNNATSSTAHCGLRANPNSPASNFNSRTSTTDWTASTASTSAADSVTISSTVFPPSGLTFTWAPPVPCTGTPIAGTVAPTTQNVCATATPATLVGTGYSSGVTGLTFQWEESDDNGVVDAWAPAVGGTGATTASYTPPAFLGTTIYYRLSVTCTNSTLSAQTASVVINPPANPTTQATNAAAANIYSNAATINWTNGNGTRRMVVLSDSATITDPVNGNAPALVANNAYSGSGQQIVFDGTASTVNVTGLTPSTTYYVKVYEYLRCGAGPYDYFYNVTSGTNATSFTTLAAPANDLCSGAVALTVGENFASNPVNGNIFGATTTAGLSPSCQTLFSADVWYSVVVPASGNVTIETQVATADTMTDSVVQVYTGACGSLTQLTCDDDSGPTGANNFMSIVNITGQTPGTTLYIAIWKYGTTNPTTTNSNFQVSAYDCPSATPAPTGNAAQSFCGSATVANLVATGTTIKWYTAATGGTAMASTDALTTGTTYYASQTVNCESFARLAVTVTINPIPDAPTGNASQTFCSSSAADLSDIVVTGTNIIWYDAATAGNVLPSTTALVSGTTYYASQTVNGCESTNRLAVTITLDAVPSAPTGAATQDYCATTTGNTLANLTVTGTGLIWYDAATGGNVLPSTTTLVDGSTYYVSQTVGTCESANRLAVTVNENCPCLTSVNGQWPPSTYTPATCDGATINTVTTCGYGSEYSVVTVTAGETYTFASSIATDIITISADNGATAAAFGVGSVTWVSTITGTVRFYTHLDGCLSSTSCRVKTVVCGTPPSTAPNCPTLTAPADLSTNMNLSVPLSWTAPTSGSSVSSYNIYVDTVTPPATLLGNVTGTTANLTGLLPGTTYYWMVNAVNVAGESTGCTIYSFTTVAAPANDDCANAVALTPGGVFADNPVTGTNVGATNSNPPAPGCASFNGGDVWYSVVVPASGSITIETGTGTITDTGMAVYSGTCGALTLIECDDDDSANGYYSMIALTGQTPGATLYVNVWEFGGDFSGDFQISAYDASLASNTFDNTSFSYYPNPVKDVLNLSYSKNIDKVQVINLIGQEVITKSINATTSEVDMSNLPSGTYIVKVTADTQTQTIKVIKE